MGESADLKVGATKAAAPRCQETAFHPTARPTLPRIVIGKSDAVHEGISRGDGRITDGWGEARWRVADSKGKSAGGKGNSACEGKIRAIDRGRRRNRAGRCAFPH